MYKDKQRQKEYQKTYQHRPGTLELRAKARRKSNYKKRYGITVEQYDQLFEYQGGRCAICNKTSTKKLNVDHDHNTGEIRGLLCGNCNKALGLFDDAIEALQAAIDYLS